ncbi:MAG: VanZ family protein [Verrucomicrobia bacterium]|nr:VanZ family protein [Verrucomicrobiota bacterium]
MNSLSQTRPRLLLALYTGLLLYGTLWPFQFTSHPGRNTTNVKRHVEWIPFTRLCPNHGLFCPRDTGLNLAMFLPFGALAALISTTGVGRMRPIVRAAAFGFSLSLLIETTQYFIPVRYPSTTDLLLNTVGAGLGGLIVFTISRTMPLNVPHQP